MYNANEHWVIVAADDVYVRRLTIAYPGDGLDRVIDPGHVQLKLVLFPEDWPICSVDMRRPTGCAPPLPSIVAAPVVCILW